MGYSEFPPSNGAAAFSASRNEAHAAAHFHRMVRIWLKVSQVF
jgi:hypothetical protein